MTKSDEDQPAPTPTPTPTPVSDVTKSDEDQPDPIGKRRLANKIPGEKLLASTPIPTPTPTQMPMPTPTPTLTLTPTAPWLDALVADSAAQDYENGPAPTPVPNVTKWDEDQPDPFGKRRLANKLPGDELYLTSPPWISAFASVARLYFLFESFCLSVCLSTHCRLEVAVFYQRGYVCVCLSDSVCLI